MAKDKHDAQTGGVPQVDDDEDGKHKRFKKKKLKTTRPVFKKSG